MSRGAPDYSNVKVGDPIHRLDDMAELAARLGSHNVYDRSGNTIWTTDFEHGLQGTGIGTDHTDSSGGLSTERSFHGDFSVKLDPRGAASSYVNWARVVHYVNAGKTGLEFSLSLDASIESFRGSLFYFRPDDTLETALLYGTDGHTWKILVDGPAWETVLSDFPLQTGGGAWHPIKFVVDFANAKWVRVQIAKNVIDVSEFDLYDREYLGAGQLFIKLQCNGSGSNHAPAWIDGVIVTQNEP